MITKNTVKTEVDFNDACSKRYYLSVEWSKDKPRAVVIMLSPSRTNGISFDRSTSYCIDNLPVFAWSVFLFANR